MELDDIKKKIAESVGNPESGAVNEVIDIIANAMNELINDKTETKKFDPVAETRVVNPAVETR